MDFYSDYYIASILKLGFLFTIFFILDKNNLAGKWYAIFLSQNNKYN